LIKVKYGFDRDNDAVYLQVLAHLPPLLFSSRRKAKSLPSGPASMTLGGSGDAIIGAGNVVFCNSADIAARNALA
jgi:hypothetical protein